MGNGSGQGLFVFRKELVVDAVQIDLVQDAVDNDGIPPDPGIKLGVGRLLQQALMPARRASSALVSSCLANMALSSPAMSWSQNSAWLPFR